MTKRTKNLLRFLVIIIILLFVIAPPLRMVLLIWATVLLGGTCAWQIPRDHQSGHPNRDH